MATEDQEREARRNGWVEQSGWKGDPAKWVGADVFLERADTFVPFLKAERTRLEGELAKRDTMLTELQRAVKAGSAAIEALQESHDADTQEQVKAAREELTAEIARASEADDHTALATATANLSALDAEQAAAKEREKAATKAAGTGEGTQRRDVPLPPEVTAWMVENKDFMSDPRKAILANQIAAEKRMKGDQRKGAEGAAFLDDVRKEVEDYLGLGPDRRSDGKVSSGGGGGGRTNESGQGKSYADLPREAKDACEKQAARLVGPNRAHKTLASWQASYAAQYFKE